MICPECEAASIPTEVVHQFVASAPIPPPPDGDAGLPHVHQVSHATVAVRCAAGHSFAVAEPAPCWCGWLPSDDSTHA